MSKNIETKITQVANANQRLHKAYTLWNSMNIKRLLNTLEPLIDFTLPAVKAQFDKTQLQLLSNNINAITSQTDFLLFIQNLYVNPCQFYDLLENSAIESINTLADSINYNKVGTEGIQNRATQIELMIKTMVTRIFGKLEQQDTTIVKELRAIVVPVQAYSNDLYAGKKEECKYRDVADIAVTINKNIEELQEYIGGKNISPLMAAWNIYYDYYELMITVICNRINKIKLI